MTGIQAINAKKLEESFITWQILNKEKSERLSFLEESVIKKDKKIHGKNLVIKIGIPLSALIGTGVGFYLAEKN